MNAEPVLGKTSLMMSCETKASLMAFVVLIECSILVCVAICAFGMTVGAFFCVNKDNNVLRIMGIFGRKSQGGYYEYI